MLYESEVQKQIQEYERQLDEIRKASGEDCANEDKQEVLQIYQKFNEEKSPKTG